MANGGARRFARFAMKARVNAANWRHSDALRRSLCAITGFIGIVLMLGCLLAVPARAAAAGAIPRLEPIPAALSEIRRGRLVAEKTEIDADYLALDAAAKRFNTKEGKDQTDQEFAAVTARRTAYIARVDDFNGWVKAEVERLRVIQAMATYLGPLGTWKSEEKKRALDALEKLDGDGDGKSGSLRIQVTWERILARQPSAQLLALAARDGGPGFPGAGTQSGQDCAVFALANASGTPYGVVAAMAAKLVGEATWRPDAERANPENTLTRQGLIGGEVALLAEMLGRVTVVPSGDFPARLHAGNKILINTFPPSGRLDRGHEVVLTKAMELEGDTWFAMKDSNQPPERVLYLTKAELDIVLQETGVMYEPEPLTLK
jgi:hypothetical protein